MLIVLRERSWDSLIYIWLGCHSTTPAPLRPATSAQLPAMERLSELGAQPTSCFLCTHLHQTHATIKVELLHLLGRSTWRLCGCVCVCVSRVSGYIFVVVVVVRLFVCRAPASTLPSETAAAAASCVCVCAHVCVSVSDPLSLLPASIANLTLCLQPSSGGTV